MRLAALLLFLSAIAVVPRAAAQLSSLEPGQRIRLHLESKQQITGVVVSATAESLTLRVHPDASATTIPVGALRSLAVSRGKPSTWTSGLSAAVMGAAVLGSTVALDEGASAGQLGKHAGWGATAGAALGLTIGTIARDEGWTPLSLPGRGVHVSEALRFPAFAVAGRWGPARGQAGSGSGGGVRMDAGIARLGDDAQLRVEFSADRSSLESVPGSYTSAERILTSQEENRRFSYGLTVIENLWRIGERVQTYASFGLGVTHSRITGEMRRPCGPAYTCNVEGVAYGFTSDRDHRGTYALVGAGVVARLQGVNVFAEFRSQMMDDGGNEPGGFVPLSLGISF